MELDRGRFRFTQEDEDIHMAIERRLTELIGPLGGKLHTGRSRNDQVALDVRLYVRDQLSQLLAHLENFQRVLVAKGKANRTVAMPGYTHLQRAQPVLLAHHLLAYVEMIERDKGRFRDASVRVNVMPLGSGALAGTNYPVDRRFHRWAVGVSRRDAKQSRCRVRPRFHDRGGLGAVDHHDAPIPASEELISGRPRSSNSSSFPMRSVPVAV
jgi:Argininosuccinate lyase